MCCSTMVRRHATDHCVRASIGARVKRPMAVWLEKTFFPKNENAWFFPEKVQMGRGGVGVRVRVRVRVRISV